MGWVKDQMIGEAPRWVPEEVLKARVHAARCWERSSASWTIKWRIRPRQHHPEGQMSTSHHLAVPPPGVTLEKPECSHQETDRQQSLPHCLQFLTL